MAGIWNPITQSYDWTGGTPAGTIVSQTTRAPQSALAASGINIKSILDSINAQQAAANGVNEQQYGALLKSTGATADNVAMRFNQANNLLSGLGASNAQRISDNAVKQGAESKQSMIGRGLYNTTVLDTAQRGVDSDAERALQASNESVAAQRSGLLQNQANADLQTGRLTADAILSRKNSGPDTTYLAELLRSLGSTSGGASGSGFSGSSFGASGGGSGSGSGSGAVNFGSIGGGDGYVSSGITTTQGTGDRPPVQSIRLNDTVQPNGFASSANAKPKTVTLTNTYSNKSPAQIAERRNQEAKLRADGYKPVSSSLWGDTWSL